jgi:Mn-containing catalase
MLMDVATEEFSHSEILGATIQMLPNGVNGELFSEEEEIMTLLQGKGAKEDYIDEAMVNPHFGVLSGGGPHIYRYQRGTLVKFFCSGIGKAVCSRFWNGNLL